MTHDRLDIILQGVCIACDYQGRDSLIKLSELKEFLRPINHNMNNKHSLEAMYGILATTLDIIKEMEHDNPEISEENIELRPRHWDVCLESVSSKKN